MKIRRTRDEWIPFAMFTYNMTSYTATGYTPFELVYGHQADLPTALTNHPSLYIITTSDGRRVKIFAHAQ